MRCAVGVGAEQDNLVGMEFLGNGAGVAADHPHRDVRPAVQALRRKGKRALLCPDHLTIVPEGESRVPARASGRKIAIDYEDRPLVVLGGQLTLHEPVCHCPECSRDLFPPADRLASGQPRLQPDGLAKITEAAARLHSFAEYSPASHNVNRLLLGPPLISWDAIQR